MYVCSHTFFTFRSSLVEISGTKYSLQNVVVLDSGLLPQFGDIIINDVHQPFLLCEKLRVVVT